MAKNKTECKTLYFTVPEMRHFSFSYQYVCNTSVVLLGEGGILSIKHVKMYKRLDMIHLKSDIVIPLHNQKVDCLKLLYS